VNAPNVAAPTTFAIPVAKRRRLWCDTPDASALADSPASLFATLSIQLAMSRPLRCAPKHNVRRSKE
jgi:hypothetical protein